MTLNSLQQYGTAFQIKVISALLTHKDFLININDIISDEYWDNQAHKWIIKEIIRYYEKYHTTPSMDILKVELKKVDNEVLRVSIKEQLREAYEASADDLEYVREEFSTFCKNQQLIEARFREDARKVIATPWERINDLLQGGLGNGDFGLIFGNPGGGKSWSLVALGGFAVRMGCNVLHYTLELGEDYVGRRYDAFFTKTPVDKILKNRKKVEDVIPQLPGELIIKEFPTGRATISTVEAHIRKVKDLGVEPDLIIIDYVDLLSTNKRTSDRKGEIDDIYTSTKGLARELNIPIWSVSQVNRAGAKDDVIEGDKAAGSYDKIMITDFCLSLSRKAKDKVNGTGRFHIMKNRYGMDGLTFGVKADTSTGHFEVHDYDPDADFESETNNQQTNSYDNFGTFDKQALKNKFFELNS